MATGLALPAEWIQNPKEIDARALKEIWTGLYFVKNAKNILQVQTKQMFVYQFLFTFNRKKGLKYSWLNPKSSIWILLKNLSTYTRISYRVD